MSSEDDQLLLSIHNELRSSARWQEESRERSSGIIVAANALIVGIVASAEFEIYAIVACPIVFMLSGLGQNFVLKYFKNADRDYRRARILLRRLDDSRAGRATIESAFEKAEADQLAAFRNSPLRHKLEELPKSRLHETWYRVHDFFRYMSVAMGAVVLVKFFFGA